MGKYSLSAELKFNRRKVKVYPTSKNFVKFKYQKNQIKNLHPTTKTIVKCVCNCCCIIKINSESIWSLIRKLPKQLYASAVLTTLGKKLLSFRYGFKVSRFKAPHCNSAQNFIKKTSQIITCLVSTYPAYLVANKNHI